MRRERSLSPDADSELAAENMWSPRQFVIIGAGNMGCVYGGRLARIGAQVAFIDLWQEHVDRINACGLRFEEPEGDFVVRATATTKPEDAPSADVVLISVNSYSTGEAAETAKRVLKPGGCCLTIQNGVGNVEVLGEALGPGRVLAGLSFQSGDLAGPGWIRHTNDGPTYMGELDRSQTARLDQLAALFGQAGLNPVLVDDIVATIWAKFVYNCGINAICALTGLRPGHIQDVPDLDQFQSAIIEEAVALVHAKGISLPDSDPKTVIKEYCSHKFHRPSMMQHIERGQQTEIDSLNGFVASESRRLGLAAPYNDALARLIKGREHRPAGLETAK